MCFKCKRKYYFRTSKYRVLKFCSSYNQDREFVVRGWSSYLYTMQSLLRHKHPVIPQMASLVSLMVVWNCSGKASRSDSTAALPASLNDFCFVLCYWTWKCNLFAVLRHHLCFIISLQYSGKWLSTIRVFRIDYLCAPNHHLVFFTNNLLSQERFDRLHCNFSQYAIWC